MTSHKIIMMANSSNDDSSSTNDSLPKTKEEAHQELGAIFRHRDWYRSRPSIGLNQQLYPISPDQALRILQKHPCLANYRFSNKNFMIPPLYFFLDSRTEASFDVIQAVYDLNPDAVQKPYLYNDKLTGLHLACKCPNEEVAKFIFSKNPAAVFCY